MKGGRHHFSYQGLGLLQSVGLFFPSFHFLGCRPMDHSSQDVSVAPFILFPHSGRGLPRTTSSQAFLAYTRLHIRPVDTRVTHI